MADKIYLKHPGMPCVPITARINWLANGKIKPLLYWTPDGSCYEVKHVYEMTPLAFLKDKGEGIRFKIRAELKEVPDPYFDVGHSSHREAYIYFAHNMFCGKNIIDERYGHPGKEFVPVMLDVFPDGEYEIVFFEAQGTMYIVDKTIEVEPRASYRAGGAGLWHKIQVRRVDADGNTLDPSTTHTTALYFEINKWFAIPKYVQVSNPCYSKP